MKNKKNLLAGLLLLLSISCSKKEMESKPYEPEKITIHNLRSDQPPTLNNVTGRVYTIIKDRLGVDESAIKPETHLVDDLHADELTLIELNTDMKNEFLIEIEDDEAEKLKTVKDYIDLVYRRLQTVVVKRPLPFEPAPLPTLPGGGGGGLGAPQGGGGISIGLNGSNIVQNTVSVESHSDVVNVNNLPDDRPDERQKSYEWEIAYNPFVLWKVISHETGTHKKVNGEWRWKALEHDNFSVVGAPSFVSVTVTPNGRAISTVGIYYAGIEVGCNVEAKIIAKEVPIGSPAVNYKKTSPLFFSNTQ